MPLTKTPLTYQVRVPDFEQGLKFYTKLLGREPDFVPHEDFAEWQLIDLCWLQLNKGTPAAGSGPLRFGVVDIESERERVQRDLGVDGFDLEEREGVPVFWGTFSDPWGNQLGFFQLRPAEN